MYWQSPLKSAIFIASLYNENKGARGELNINPQKYQKN